MIAKGLEGVVIADSAISLVDGKNGRLLYRGYAIGDLARFSTYEETAYLLLFGSLPSRAQLASFSRVLRRSRRLSKPLLEVLAGPCRHLLPIDALRTAVSLLVQDDPCPGDRSLEAVLERGIRLIALFPSIAATHYRLSQGQKPIAPDATLGHAANFLWMLTGKKPPAEEARLVDLDLILHAEHSLNASTFAARVTASTLSDLYAAVTTAVGTLKGPLHGGAASAVVAMLDQIGSESRVRAYIQETVRTHGRVMGFGHREYKVLDPRVPVMRDVASRLEKGRRYYEILRALEREMAPLGKKGIFPNVDLYSGTVYHSLSIPQPLFDPLFALGRIAGWVAHVHEQLADNRLIRPRSAYTGPKARRYVPLEERP
ncbi:MAG: citrate synthase [Candidatus Aenigmarchaeota archaeon]|nr:citrate synthase [Candidatus Aenigmarchaeota archaeon]